MLNAPDHALHWFLSIWGYTFSFNGCTFRVGEKKFKLFVICFDNVNKTFTLVLLGANLQ